MKPEFFGTTTFMQRTQLTDADLKQLEARGILKPIKTDSGHRLWTADDIQIGQTWKKLKPRNVRKVGRK